MCPDYCTTMLFNVYYRSDRDQSIVESTSQTLWLVVNQRAIAQRSK